MGRLVADAAPVASPTKEKNHGYDSARQADAEKYAFEEVTMEMAKAGAIAANSMIDQASWEAEEANRFPELAARVWGAMRSAQACDLL